MHRSQELKRLLVALFHMKVSPSVGQKVTFVFLSYIRLIMLMGMCLQVRGMWQVAVEGAPWVHLLYHRQIVTMHPLCRHSKGNPSTSMNCSPVLVVQVG